MRDRETVPGTKYEYRKEDINLGKNTKKYVKIK
jgi:hypothetical protein